jgi:hypothetical protein
MNTGTKVGLVLLGILVLLLVGAIVVWKSMAGTSWGGGW